MDFQVVIAATGPAPTGDDFATTTSSIAPSAPVVCEPSNMGAAVEVVIALSNMFCTGLDLTKSSVNTLQGSSSGLQDADATSVAFNFTQTADTCALGCNASYKHMVQTCKFHSS